MKYLTTIAFLLFMGGALQAQLMDCPARSTLMECQNPDARYSVEIRTLDYEPVMELNTPNLSYFFGNLELPVGEFRILIFQDGVLVSEQIRVQG